MTKQNKRAVQKIIEDMTEEDQTNLWHGLIQGIQLFGNEANTGRVPAIMLLTDGCPNHLLVDHGFNPFESRTLIDHAESRLRDTSRS